ncbi:hypothetical protein Pmani_002018 [Petrolisthes manimaculis]|uniref:DDE-1 domain-containing protein n=1 Tax=Petrolisthes manimaculis TaxID=1843537 RepID=A0AAE1QLV5_9EUCA|nr:hypothetical protein Pmani_002018 [Petrolisthes manimaculis]
MVRHYTPIIDRQPRSYTDDDLHHALQLITEGQPITRVAAMMKIPRRTLRNHASGERKTTIASRKRILLPEEETIIVQHAAVLGHFGYVFDVYELRLFVKSFLDKAQRNAPQFKDNMPGEEWALSFIKRHSDVLSTHVCQNISWKRAAVGVEAVEKFFTNLSTNLQGVPPQNIVNYDETNLTDDPKSKTMLFRKSIKHPEKVMNTSKSSVSIMFACSAAGNQLPPYVVYKAEQLMDTWVRGGPLMVRYNRTHSGWFDAHCFSDWLTKIAVQYFQSLDNDAPKFLIGDNLASHMSATTEGVRTEMNINFIFLPPNSTHLLQPLDVAMYGPMKKAWRKVLTEWKEGPGKYYTALPKQWFPSLLFQLLDEMDNRDELAVAGFRATGIYPIDKDHIMRKITNENVKSAHDLVSPLVLEHLRQIKESAANNPNATRCGKCVQVELGKSISLQELGANTSATFVSRSVKRCAAGGRGEHRGKVAKIPVPVDSPSFSDSDENADDTYEVPVGEDSSDNSIDWGLEVSVGGNKHEQESDGDTSDTWNIEEVYVEKHEVEELPEDDFEVGDYGNDW